MISLFSSTWWQSLPPLMPVWSFISVPLRTPWPSQDCAYTKQYLVNDLTDDKGEGGCKAAQR